MRRIFCRAFGLLLLGLALGAPAALSGCGSSVPEGTMAEKLPGQDEGQKASMKHMMDMAKPAKKKAS